MIDLFIWGMKLFSHFPLRVLRSMGWLLGHLLMVFGHSRRRVVLVNLSLCFPALNRWQRLNLARKHLVCVAQSFLDTSWLWHADEATLIRRARLKGRVDLLEDLAPVVLFAPHFVGLDAGGAALAQSRKTPLSAIYARQRNPKLDEWVRHGRERFGTVHMYNRQEGVKPVVAALRSGAKLHLSPDMDLGEKDAVFVPFFGVSTATVTSLSRLALLGKAKVVPVITRMVHDGYESEVLPAWSGFPTRDAGADTALMNRYLEQIIMTQPEQYYWVHKRFKTRPPGSSGVYDKTPI